MLRLTGSSPSNIWANLCESLLFVKCILDSHYIGRRLERASTLPDFHPYHARISVVRLGAHTRGFGLASACSLSEPIMDYVESGERLRGFWALAAWHDALYCLMLRYSGVSSLCHIYSTDYQPQGKRGVLDLKRHDPGHMH